MLQEPETRPVDFVHEGTTDITVLYVWRMDERFEGKKCPSVGMGDSTVYRCCHHVEVFNEQISTIVRQKERSLRAKSNLEGVLPSAFQFIDFSINGGTYLNFFVRFESDCLYCQLPLHKSNPSRRGAHRVSQDFERF